MNAPFTPLRSLHLNTCAYHTVVACYETSEMTWRQLLADVSVLRDQVEALPGTAWALFHEESYPFTVALLCLLSLGRTVYLPANNTTGTAASLRNFCDHFIGDWPQAVVIPIAQCSDPAPLQILTGQLVLFTSGSTGIPKAITKNIAQIDAELQTHAQLWGALWRDAQVLATVSHQHIYGLLFKVLGPLCSGRRFHSATFRDPANLLRKAANRASIWIASPAHLQRLQNDYPWHAQQLVAIFSSGGELASSAAQHCRDLSGHWPIEIYGSSETGGIATRTQERNNIDWQPMPGVTISIDETLRIRSPYLPDSNWFVTADRAVRRDTETESNSKFQLGARADRIVKIEGKRVSLPEIELQLSDHPWVKQARATVVNGDRQRIGMVAELSEIGVQQLINLGTLALSRELRIHLQHYFEPVVLPRLWRFTTIPIDSQGKVSAAALAALFGDTEKKSLVTMPVIHRSEISASFCTLIMHVPHDLSYLHGHFPGTAVVPGVALLRWVEYFARTHLAITGICRQLEVVKFKQLVRPGDELTLVLDYRPDTEKLKFTYTSLRGEHSSGRLRFEVENA